MNKNQKNDQQSQGTKTGQSQQSGNNDKENKNRGFGSSKKSSGMTDEETNQVKNEHPLTRKEHDDTNHEHEYKTPVGEPNQKNYQESRDNKTGQKQNQDRQRGEYNPSKKSSDNNDYGKSEEGDFDQPTGKKYDENGHLYDSKNSAGEQGQNKDKTTPNQNTFDSNNKSGNQNR